MPSKNHFSNPSSLHIFMSNYGVTSNGLLQNINAMSLFSHQTNLVSIQYHGITLLSIYKSNSFLRPLIVVSLCGQFTVFSQTEGPAVTALEASMYMDRHLNHGKYSTVQKTLIQAYNDWVPKKEERSNNASGIRLDLQTQFQERKFGLLLN